MTGSGGRMRAFSLLIILVLTAACRHASDVSGLYGDALTKDAMSTPGSFIPCDQPRTVWLVRDSALIAAYRRTVTRPYELVFVRLRGVPSDSGSVYGGIRHILVHDVVELRARRPGDCPGVPDSVLHSVAAAAPPS